jgi:hypothetical protein
LTAGYFEAFQSPSTAQVVVLLCRKTLCTGTDQVAQRKFY